MDPRLEQGAPKRGRSKAAAIVISEHRDNRNIDCSQNLRGRFNFDQASAIGDIAGDDERIDPLGEETEDSFEVLS
jgi:hypothetical protein